LGKKDQARGSAAVRARCQPSAVSRWLSVVVGFYRVCVIDAILAHSPADQIRRPGGDGVASGRHRHRLEPTGSEHVAPGTNGVTITDSGRRSDGRDHGCVIDVCSAVPVPDDTGWHHLARADCDSRYRATKSGTEWCRKILDDIAH
jgi:hypothetical protein